MCIIRYWCFGKKLIWPQSLFVFCNFNQVCNWRASRRYNWGVCFRFQTSISCKFITSQLNISSYVSLEGLGVQRVGDKLHGGPGLSHVYFLWQTSSLSLFNSNTDGPMESIHLLRWESWVASWWPRQSAGSLPARSWWSEVLRWSLHMCCRYGANISPLEYFRSIDWEWKGSPQGYLFVLFPPLWWQLRIRSKTKN